VTQAQKVRRRLRAFLLNRPGTEAQLVFAEGVWHFRSDGFAHWMEASAEEALFAGIAGFTLDARRRELAVRFQDGSRLVARKTRLGPRVRNT